MSNTTIESNQSKAWNNLTLVLSILSIAIGVIGVVLTALGGGMATVAVIAVALINSAAIIAIGLYSLHQRLTLEERNRKDAEIRQEREEAIVLHANRHAKELQQMITMQTDVIRSDKSDFNYMLSVLSKSLDRLYNLSDSYYEERMRIEDQHDIMMQFTVESNGQLGYHEAIEADHGTRLEGLLSRTRAECIKLHNVFMCNAINRTKQMIESYLESKGFSLRVSIAVKSFLNPASRNELFKNGMARNVYTSFRDTDTWEERKRIDVPTRKYSVARNTDFYHCLSGNKYYIYNNESETDTDFHIEGGNFGRYYNSGITSLIASEGIDNSASALVYGFLTCDVMNTKTDEEAFDEYAAMVLMGACKLIAIYYGTLAEVWLYMDLDNVRFGVESLDEDWSTAIAEDDAARKGFWREYIGYLDRSKEQKEGLS